MSGITEKKNNAAALDESAAAVQRVVSLIRNVLRKYPHNTLVFGLLPFLEPNRMIGFRRSSDTRDVVVAEMGGFRRTTTFRFPVALLDAQESEVTRWARDRYWEGCRETRKNLHKAALNTAQSARSSLDRAQKEYDQAVKTLAETESPSGRKHRARISAGAGTSFDPKG